MLYATICSLPSIKTLDYVFKLAPWTRASALFGRVLMTYNHGNVDDGNGMSGRQCIDPTDFNSRLVLHLRLWSFSSSSSNAVSADSEVYAARYFHLLVNSLKLYTNHGPPRNLDLNLVLMVNVVD